MNKYLFFLILGVNISLNAQKRTNYLGASVSFNGSTSVTNEESDDPNNYITKNFTVAPEIQWGYYINNSTVAGIGFKYTFLLRRNSDRYSYEKSERNRDIEFIPFIRRYRMLGNRWAIFFHTEIGPKCNCVKIYSKGIESYESKYQIWQYNLSIKPGVVYFFPNKKWALEGYANIASLGATFIPATSHNPRQFFLNSSFYNPQSPIYFSLRLARYISSKKI